jgi:CheY-like chemotaxis protein
MRHRVLLIEDSPANRATVAQYLDACGIDCVAVASLEEARPIIDAGSFCLILTDLEILPTAGATKPDLALGYVGIEYARTRYPARNDEIHLMPILVMSAHAKFEVLRRTMHLKIDDFLKKPPTELREAVQSALEKAGRRDHADCERLTRLARVGGSTPPPAPSPADADVPSGLRVRILPDQVNGRTQVRLADKAVWLTPTLLRALLHLVAGRLRASDGWVARDEMGRDAAAVVRALSRLREELGHRIDDADKIRGYRLRTDIALDPVPAAELARLPGEAMIARLASEIARLQRT